MNIHTFLILSLAFMSLLTGVVVATNFEDRNNKQWAWATGFFVVLIISFIIKK